MLCTTFIINLFTMKVLKKEKGFTPTPNFGVGLQSKRGFTLIELLVVIAIIGILASIVLASLNTARDRGRDASIRASMSQMRAQAEIYYDTQTPPNYTTVCTGASTIDLDDLATAAQAQIAAPTGYDCDPAAQAWAAEISLNGGGFFCVDSTGFAGNQAATKGGSATVCN
jgi:prepilin-type N-terminal cleavage/methylation domain-containing protein